MQTDNLYTGLPSHFPHMFFFQIASSYSICPQDIYFLIHNEHREGVGRGVKPISHLYFGMFVTRKRQLWKWWLWGSQSSLLQWGALHVYRLARKLWSSDGEKGCLGVRIGKRMGRPLWETSGFCPGLCWWELLSCCHKYLFQSDSGNTQEIMLWAFPLPSV